jgi:hypothetical protein
MHFGSGRLLAQGRFSSILVLALIALFVAPTSPIAHAQSSQLLTVLTPTEGNTVTPGTTFSVAASPEVALVQYFISSNSYTGRLSNYLGASTEEPNFLFTWEQPASSIVFGGYGSFSVQAQAYDAAGNRIENGVGTVSSVEVPGTLFGPDLPRALNGSTANLFGSTIRSNITIRANERTYFAEFNGAGASVDFRPNLSVAGVYDLAIRYANVERSTSPLTLEINGERIVADLVFPQILPNPLTETSVTLLVALNAGTNSIKLTARDTNAPNIAFISIAQPPVATPAPRLQVNPSELSLPAARRTATLGVQNDDGTIPVYTVTSNAHWLRVVSQRDSTLIIEALRNRGAARVGTLTIVAGDNSVTVTVNQAGQ